MMEAEAGRSFGGSAGSVGSNGSDGIVVKGGDLEEAVAVEGAAALHEAERLQQQQQQQQQQQHDMTMDAASASSGGTFGTGAATHGGTTPGSQSVASLGSDTAARHPEPVSHHSMHKLTFLGTLAVLYANVITDGFTAFILYDTQHYWWCVFTLLSMMLGAVCLAAFRLYRLLRAALRHQKTSPKAWLMVPATLLRLDVAAAAVNVWQQAKASGWQEGAVDMQPSGPAATEGTALSLMDGKFYEAMTEALPGSLLQGYALLVLRLGTLPADTTAIGGWQIVMQAASFVVSIISLSLTVTFVRISFDVSPRQNALSRFNVLVWTFTEIAMKALSLSFLGAAFRAYLFIAVLIVFILKAILTAVLFPAMSIADKVVYFLLSNLLWFDMQDPTERRWPQRFMFGFDMLVSLTFVTLAAIPGMRPSDDDPLIFGADVLVGLCPEQRMGCPGFPRSYAINFFVLFLVTVTCFIAQEFRLLNTHQPGDRALRSLCGNCCCRHAVCCTGWPCGPLALAPMNNLHNQAGSMSHDSNGSWPAGSGEASLRDVEADASGRRGSVGSGGSGGSIPGVDAPPVMIPGPHGEVIMAGAGQPLFKYRKPRSKKHLRLNPNKKRKKHRRHRTRSGHQHLRQLNRVNLSEAEESEASDSDSSGWTSGGTGVSDSEPEEGPGGARDAGRLRRHGDDTQEEGQEDQEVAADGADMAGPGAGAGVGVGAGVGIGIGGSTGSARGHRGSLVGGANVIVEEAPSDLESPALDASGNGRPPAGAGVASLAAEGAVGRAGGGDPIIHNVHAPGDSREPSLSRASLPCAVPSPQANQLLPMNAAAAQAAHDAADAIDASRASLPDAGSNLVHAASPPHGAPPEDAV